MARKSKKAPPRNALAVHAKNRTAGKVPMKHRLEPKKGASNDQPELLERSEDSSDLMPHCYDCMNDNEASSYIDYTCVCGCEDCTLAFTFER